MGIFIVSSENEKSSHPFFVFILGRANSATQLSRLILIAAEAGNWQCEAALRLLPFLHDSFPKLLSFLKRLQNSQGGASALGDNQQVMEKANNLRTSLSSPYPPDSPLMGTWVCEQSLCFYLSLHKEAPLICSEARFSSESMRNCILPKRVKQRDTQKGNRDFVLKLTIALYNHCFFSLSYSFALQSKPWFALS